MEKPAYDMRISYWSSDVCSSDLFMSRFLSPQVARLVAEQGLARAMQDDHRGITIVCCDLRGFTPYAAARSSSQVLQVLREYYDAVGDEIGVGLCRVKECQTVTK